LRLASGSLLLSILLLACSCSALQRHHDAKPEVIRQTEAALSDAGFRAIGIDTSDHASLASTLPPHEIRSYGAQSRTVYWYYDPDLCGCLYEGDQPSFDRYQLAMRQQHDTEIYASESRDEEVASLNAINGGIFPPPIFLLGVGGIYGGYGGYPVPPPGGGHHHHPGGNPGAGNPGAPGHIPAPGHSSGPVVGGPGIGGGGHGIGGGHGMGGGHGGHGH
jgi:hypothetical protein